MKNFLSCGIINNHYQITIFGIRVKFKCNHRKNHNKIYIIDKDGTQKEVRGTIKGLNISIEGKNNKICIGYPYNFVNSKISIRGDNNTITIEPTKHVINNLYIDMWGRIKSGREVHIKKNLFMNGCTIFSWTNNSTIVIGEECMFSWNVAIMNSDGHIVEDLDTKRQINHGNFCEIGDNVWVCQNVFIGKNVKVPSNSIVGANTVLTKTFNEKNVAIAGNPAKVIKRGISWKRDCDD